MRNNFKFILFTFISLVSLLLTKQTHAAGVYSDEGIAFYAQISAPAYAYENVVFYAYDPSSTQPEGSLPVYRFYNSSNSDHFYTTSETEKDKLVNNPSMGYTLESTAFFADPNQKDSSELPVYRFYNTLNGDHFYTSSEKEKASVLNNPQWGYIYERIAFYAFPSQAEGTLPVYRFYNAKTGDHFYTASENEKNKIAIALVYRFYNSSTGDHFYTISKKENDKLASNPQSGYLAEGTAFYAYLNQASGTSPIYRFYNSSTGDHFYTASESEKTNLQSDASYAYEGIAFYTYTSQATNTSPVYRIYNSNTGDHFYTISLTERNRALTSGLGQDISVGLFGLSKSTIQSKSFKIVSDEKYNVRDDNGNIITQINGGTTTEVTYDADGNLKVFGSIADTLVANSVTFDAADGDNTNIVFDINRSDYTSDWRGAIDHYRGQIKTQYYHGSDTLDLDGDKNTDEQVQQVWIINILPLEQYTWGAAELYGTGDMDHSKVMVTAFRSFGYRRVQSTASSYSGYGFRVLANSSDQNYGGYDWEQNWPNVRKAAEQTRGITVTYGGSTVVTPYSSWSAGNSRTYGSSRPWCMSVSDPYGNYNDSYWNNPTNKTQDQLIADGNHMYGLIAKGSVRLAADYGWDWKRILKYYYRGIGLTTNY